MSKYYTGMESLERDDDVVASLAVTLDGFIARPDGSVDYLEKYPIAEFDFDAWVDRVGAVVMGHSSYEVTVGFGWALGDRPTLVLTGATDLAVPDGADVTFQAAPTAGAIRAFAAETPGRLWVFGGAQVVTAALLGGVVDVLDITVVPEAIGEGIPLFSEAFAAPMKIAQAVPYGNGAVRLVYEIDHAA
jgi:dihydrofolate reductase